MQIEIWLALGNESLSANDSFYFFSTRDRKLMASLQIQEQLHPEAADFRLFISDSTLKNHLTTIYSKLELKNRIDLLKFAVKHKLDKS